ncbi:hypothetical protein [Noviherbaspirillum sp.]|uniref:hypothetical protein n=1 Tax=Noviherbaspirillum sp. TaxID=1926288 RepID=UPI002B4A22CE|nr:hypothetical protein [Noviherbaspirillum sp.]HJV83671.1 hypothetical protein [Noviherbaspirillum sp.]
MNIANHPAYSMAVPTSEHFLPLAYLAGLSIAAKQPAEVLVDGGTMGALTMTSFVLGCGTMKKTDLVQSAALLPNPAEVPPEHTNT